VFVKRLGDCRELTAGDGTRLRELLHPERDPVECRYSLAIAWIEPGCASLPHRLKQTEVYYLIRGTGVMHVGDDVKRSETSPRREEERRVSAGDVVYIPAGAVQWLENDGSEVIEFACIVDPAWTAEGEEVP
jgi:mannose-6-phosphate isomerase-like protein (cupin superfamily)